jgi:hypothetical protein
MQLVGVCLQSAEYLLYRRPSMGVAIDGHLLSCSVDELIPHMENFIALIKDVARDLGHPVL